MGEGGGRDPAAQPHHTIPRGDTLSWGAQGAPGAAGVPAGGIHLGTNEQPKMQSVKDQFTFKQFFPPSDAVPPHWAFLCGLIPPSHPLASRWGPSGGISLPLISDGGD